CREKGIGTAIETCGYFNSAYLPELVENTDVLLWDLKDTDDERHQKYTGVSNKKILENLRNADKLGAKIILRCIMISGVNMDENHYHAIAEVYHSLSGCTEVELLPYHVYGGSKTLAVGKTDRGTEDWIPTGDQMIQARSYLQSCNVNVK
ncbi:MAG: radical SAM protein, partial [Roseburia sp.]|nr:radical SAM protein [Roseburia sp.]